MAEANPMPPPQLRVVKSAKEQSNAPLKFYLAVNCQRDEILGVRIGIGISSEHSHFLNFSKSLCGIQTTERAELAVMRLAMIFAQNIPGRRVISFYTDSEFIMEVGTTWLPLAQFFGVNSTRKEEVEDAIAEFNSLLAEYRDLPCTWVLLPKINVNPGFQKAVELAESGKNYCPWYK